MVAALSVGVAAVPLREEISTVSFVAYHTKHFAVLEVNPRKRRVGVWETLRVDKVDRAVELFRDCVLATLWTN